MLAPIALTGLTLAASDLETASRFYTDAFGLRRVDGTPDSVCLNAQSGPSPLLRLIEETPDIRGLCELRFAARDRAHLAELRTRAIALGHVTVTGDDSGFALSDPDGTSILVKVAQDPSRMPHGAAGDRPLYMSHVVLNSRQPARLASFYKDTLGFEVSDSYERELLVFMRCDQPQHHCIGVAPSPTDGLNHFAVDCGDVDGLMRAVSRMRACGHESVWGPGRHGPGGNIFCYFEGPDGIVPEFTCDVLQIGDGDRHRPQIWARTPENGNVWLTGAPSPRALELMSGEPAAIGEPKPAALTTE